MSAENYQYRRVSANWILLTLASVVMVFALIVLIRREIAHPTSTQSNLVVYCAAGIRKPVEAAAKQYEKEYDVAIRLDYGSTGELESKIALEQENKAPRCDLYIPADQFFSDRARNRGLTKGAIPLAQFRVVLAVKPDSTLRIKSIRDLLSQNLSYVICNEQAGVGNRTQSALKARDLWEEVFRNKKSSFPRVPEAANAVKTSDDIQAAFIWDATARQFGLKTIECPELATGIATISADVTAQTAKTKEALHFARYLAAPEKGKPFFKQFHFETLPGDPWEEVPELVIYCGGVKHNALVGTFTDFGKQGGCLIKTQYAGCGTIVGNIKARKFHLPDMFMTCDANYMDRVSSDLMEASDGSSNKVVIMVRRGNPKNIRSLLDLVQPDVSIGTTGPKLSTLSALSWQMFEEAGIKEQMEKHQSVIVTTPTAHESVLQMEGYTKLDAALIYEANCQKLTKRFDLIRIDLPTAKTVQNTVAGKQSRHLQASNDRYQRRQAAVSAL
ncbi:MAG: hypothetical protein M2R45_01960 [Verrucomicrobia subdivision 3 bacterium]|nr:hypothetical protein [Limisphaerales bacterium]MCS1416173.1 hypothetical protein [Limisphaerales bacterium]